MWMTSELLPEFWDFWSKFRWSPSSSKLEGPHEVILGDIPFFMEQATCALIFSKSIQSSCAQLSPCLKGKNPTQIGHHMWKILAPKFGQHTKPPPKNKKCQPNRKSHMLGVWEFICYFGPHGIGHHPTCRNPCQLRLIYRHRFSTLAGVMNTNPSHTTHVNG
jgi:hypothetical protein